MADKDYDSSDDEEKTIADDIVVTKYNMAAKIANGNSFYTAMGHSRNFSYTPCGRHSFL